MTAVTKRLKTELSSIAKIVKQLKSKLFRGVIRELRTQTLKKSLLFWQNTAQAGNNKFMLSKITFATGGQVKVRYKAAEPHHTKADTAD